MELALAQPMMSPNAPEPKAFSDFREPQKQHFYDEDGNLEGFEFMVLERSKPFGNIIDFFFIGIEVTILLISIIKCGILQDGKLFVIIGGVLSSVNGGIAFNSLEQAVSSPRMLSIFTTCFLARSKFLGSVNTPHALQYTILKNFPYYIACLHTFDQLIRRQLVLTLDDIIFALIYCMICQVELQMPQPVYLTPLAEYLQQKVFSTKEIEKPADS